MSRPIPTAEDRAKAKRLKALWTAKKKELGLTQLTAAKKLNIAQPTLSQYVNGIIPLNTDAVLKFADLLELAAHEIDPRLKNIQSLNRAREAKVKRVRLPMIGSVSGKSVLGHAAIMLEDLPEEGVYAGVSVDSHSLNEAGVPKGSTILLDLDAEPFVKFRNIVVRLRGEDGFLLLQYLESTASSIRVKDLAENRNRTLQLSKIAQAHLVYSITMPQ